MAKHAKIIQNDEREQELPQKRESENQSQEDSEEQSQEKLENHQEQKPNYSQEQKSEGKQEQAPEPLQAKHLRKYIKVISVCVFIAVVVVVAATVTLFKLDIITFDKKIASLDSYKTLGIATAEHAEDSLQNTFTFIETSWRQSLEPEYRLDECEPYTPTSKDLKNLKSSKEPFAFTLNSNSADPKPQLSEASTKAFNKALEPYLNRGWDVGFMLIDLNTGRGIASNLDQRVYGASSIKALYSLYVCETQIDTGKVSGSSQRSAGVASSYLDSESSTRSGSIASLIESSILYSDNNAFRILRANFDGSAFRGWLTDCGIDSALADDTWYPRYSARESATLWLRMASYLESDASCAEWLKGLLDSTNKSFIREAIGSDTTKVYNKAGWIAGTGYFNGTCDAGIVEKDGHRWILSIMSSASDSSVSEDAEIELIKQLWEARSDLMS